MRNAHTAWHIYILTLLSILVATMIFPIFAFGRAWRCRKTASAIAEESLYIGMLGIMCAYAAIELLPPHGSRQIVGLILPNMCVAFYCALGIYNSKLREKAEKAETQLA